MELTYIRAKLAEFFSGLDAFMQKAVTAPKLMWQQTADEPGSRLMLLVFLLAFAAGALYLVLSFLRVPFREKLRMLRNLVLVTLMVLVIFWFALM